MALEIYWTKIHISPPKTHRKVCADILHLKIRNINNKKKYIFQNIIILSLSFLRKLYFLYKYDFTNKNMIAASKISEIVNKIILGYNPDKIILFGSYAKGNPNEDSDLDIFVIKETDLTRPERTVQVRKLLYGARVPIDLIVYTPKEIVDSKKNKSVFINEVLKFGKILYERAD